MPCSASPRPNPLRLFTVAAACAATVNSFAQTANDDLLRQREQQRQAAEAQRTATAPIAKPATPARSREELPTEAPCFPVQSIVLEGGEPFPFLAGEVAGLRGGCIGVRGLQVVQRNLQRALIERGLVTSRVLLPEQNISGGTLRVLVAAGRIGKIAQQGPARGVWQSVLSARSGDLLDQRQLDSAIEHLRRLPTEQRAEIDVKPAAEPGSSDLVLKHPDGKRWRLGASLDNAGSPSTGRIGAAVTLGIDSPLHLYDQLTFSHNTNAQRSSAFGNSGDTLSWNAPWGAWSFSLGTDRYEYLQSVAGFSGPIRYSGSSHGYEAGLGWTAWRSAAAKTSLQAKFLRRASRSFIEDVEVDVQARDVGLLDVSIAHRHHIGDAVLDASVGAKRGLPSQSSKPGVVIGEPGYDGSFSVRYAQASVQAPFSLADVPFSYRGSMRVQHAPGVVPTSDYVSIGNRYSVRGFSGERSLAAQHGAFVRNELACPFACAWLPGSQGCELYAALDAGLVRGSASEFLAGRDLAGAGVGVRARAAGFAIDVAITAPLRQPENFGARKTAAYLSLAYEY